MRELAHGLQLDQITVGVVSQEGAETERPFAPNQSCYFTWVDDLVDSDLISLALPEYEGQIVVAQMTETEATQVGVDTSTYDSSGNNFLSFTAAGDMVVLIGCRCNANSLRWRVLVADGATVVGG